jgi:hypothetical protein
MMASDRTKILFSTDRAADGGTMPYTLKAVAAPRKSRVFTRDDPYPGDLRRLVEFIDENGRWLPGVLLQKRHSKMR